MALLEFLCRNCKIQFEQISSAEDPDRGQCPKCSSRETEKLISLFAVGGRGDLRESTLHGCHEPHVVTPDQNDGGHVHGPHCNHSGDKH